MRHVSKRILAGLLLLPALLLALVVYAGTHRASAAASFMVSEVNYGFSPSTLTVQVGDTVTWTNTSSASHTTQSDGGWNSGNMGPGASYSFTFNTPGTYSYYCLYHRGLGMVGTIIVMGAAAAPTNTATSVPSNTPIPQLTATSTPVPPTSTATPVPPTSTFTPVPPTATSTITPTGTFTPVPPTSTATATPRPTLTPTATRTPLAVQIHLAAPVIDRGQTQRAQVRTAPHARLAFSVHFAGTSPALHGTALAGANGLATFSFPVLSGPGPHQTSLAATLQVTAFGAGGAQGSATAPFTVYPSLRLQVTIHSARVRGTLVLMIQTSIARRGLVRVTVTVPGRNVRPAAVTGVADGKHPLLLSVSLGKVKGPVSTVVQVQVTTREGATETLIRHYLARA
jgi:plastocyanin